MKSLFWLVRRELWESRAVWVAPLICALIIIGGALLASLHLGQVVVNVDGHGSSFTMGGLVDSMNAGLTPAKAQSIVSLTLGGIAVPFFITILFTQFFYTLDALYGERRDRSILFWKSLPVSDAETVLAKLAVAGLLIPVAAMLAAFATQLLVCAIASASVSSAPLLAAQLWNPATWADSLLLMSYVLVGGILWYLPLLGWLLLVSASVPRSPFLWAFLPPLALALAEYVVFHTSFLLQVIGERFGNTGLFAHAFTGMHGSGLTIGVEDQVLAVPHALTELMRPAAFFGSASLWVGVAVGIGLVAAAIWMRRYRDATA
jgi:ABC-2 type transport system permease protein